jgi:hypothetical protein
MKVLLLVLLLISCSQKFTIPDVPKYKDMTIYQIEGMVCFDRESAQILSDNIKLQKEYADKLRKILEDIK